MPVKIVLVEDHPLVVRGLVSVLTSDTEIEVCGTASGMEEGMQQIEQCKPDIAVIDLGLADGDGLEMVREIRQRELPTQTIVSSMREESKYAGVAQISGARGFISKSLPPDLLAKAIHHVMDGGTFFPSRQAVHADSHVGDQTFDQTCCHIGELSERELQVLRMIGRGMDTREIAEALDRKKKTVESFRERIKRKLEIENASRLVHFATLWTMAHEDLNTA